MLKHVFKRLPYTRSALILFVLFGATVLQGQALLSGKVLDESTGHGIPFVNIGVVGADIGTVSDEKGRFYLKSGSTKDSVAFSSVGYGTRVLALVDLQKQRTVNLHPVVYTFPKVEVVGEVGDDMRILGHKLEKKGHSIGFTSQQLGTEIGAHIRINRKLMLTSAHFTLNHTGGDSLLFRLNLREFQKGEVGRKLFPHNVILRFPQESGTVEVDLTAFELVVEEDVLMTLEWIRDAEGEGNEGITFRSSTGGRENAYIKQTSLSNYIKVSDVAEGAPGLRLGFYLKGREAK